MGAAAGTLRIKDPLLQRQHSSAVNNPAFSEQALIATVGFQRKLRSNSEQLFEALKSRSYEEIEKALQLAKQGGKKLVLIDKKKEYLEDHLLHIAQTILNRLFNLEFSRRAVKYASEPKWS